MMKLEEILPLLVNYLINFDIEYNRIMYNTEINIKRPDLLQIDLCNIIYKAYINRFGTDEVYEINILDSINPFHTTYNKLSCDDNILETLVAYLVDYIIRFRIPLSKENVIVSLDTDVPFELGLNIKLGWIKQFIDIYI